MIAGMRGIGIVGMRRQADLARGEPMSGGRGGERGGGKVGRMRGERGRGKEGEGGNEDELILDPISEGVISQDRSIRRVRQRGGKRQANKRKTIIQRPISGRSTARHLPPRCPFPAVRG